MSRMSASVYCTDDSVGEAGTRLESNPKASSCRIVEVDETPYKGFPLQPRESLVDHRQRLVIYLSTNLLD